MPRGLLAIAAILGLLATALGLLALLRPGSAPFPGSATPPPVVAMTGPTVWSLVQIAGGLLAAAGALAVRRSRSGAPVALSALAILEIAVFGLGSSSLTVLSGAGYLLALAMPAIVAAAGLSLLVRGRTPGRVTGAAILLGLITLAVLLREQIVHIAETLTPALLGQVGEMSATALFVLTAVVWAVILVGAVRGSSALARGGRWVLRHRVALTVVAAASALPYALLRLTWLTPWPQLGGEAAADPSTRLWGLVLSSGAWCGALLTMGLVRPWGEVFPRWFPVIGGRRVPVAVAAVPGFAVAGLLCCAAVPMALMGLSAPGGASLLLVVESLIAFPCWLWGPSLGLAVWGYVEHRRAIGR